jgi:hypothetical protein
MYATPKKVGKRRKNQKVGKKFVLVWRPLLCLFLQDTENRFTVHWIIFSSLLNDLKPRPAAKTYIEEQSPNSQLTKTNSIIDRHWLVEEMLRTFVKY